MISCNRYKTGNWLPAANAPDHRSGRARVTASVAQALRHRTPDTAARRPQLALPLTLRALPAPRILLPTKSPEDTA